MADTVSLNHVSSWFSNNACVVFTIILRRKTACQNNTVQDPNSLHLSSALCHHTLRIILPLIPTNIYWPSHNIIPPTWGIGGGGGHQNKSVSSMIIITLTLGNSLCQDSADEKGPLSLFAVQFCIFVFVFLVKIKHAILMSREPCLDIIITQRWTHICSCHKIAIVFCVPSFLIHWHFIQYQICLLNYSLISVEYFFCFEIFLLLSFQLTF